MAKKISKCNFIFEFLKNLSIKFKIFVFSTNESNSFKVDCRMLQAANAN